MMSSGLTIYSYSACSTCRKALKWLSENDIDYELIDIVKNPPSKKILREVLDCLENRRMIFNTSGISYRKLGSQLVKKMSNEEALEALSSDGRLIKRPLVISQEGKVLVGFKPEVWSQALLC